MKCVSDEEEHVGIVVNVVSLGVRDASDQSGRIAPAITKRGWSGRLVIGCCALFS